MSTKYHSLDQPRYVIFYCALYCTSKSAFICCIIIVFQFVNDQTIIKDGYSLTILCQLTYIFVVAVYFNFRVGDQ